MLSRCTRAHPRASTRLTLPPRLGSRKPGVNHQLHSFHCFRHTACPAAARNACPALCGAAAYGAARHRRGAARRSVDRREGGEVVSHHALLGLPEGIADVSEIERAYAAARKMAEELPSESLVKELHEAYQAVLSEATAVAPASASAAPRGQLAAEANVVPGSQKVFLQTFGCQHNQSDGEYMLGQLQDYGYTVVQDVEACDVCVVNSCTVKTPSESRGLHLVNKASQLQKAVVLAGCVPSADQSLPKRLPHVSMLEVSQLDRIVEVVEEASKGRVVTLLEKKKSGATLPSLSLPKVRQDRLTEIITINAGCLNFCTYCKTRQARGGVKSYALEDLVQRAREAVAEGVCHIELASEDMGAYGYDRKTNIGELLLRLSDALLDLQASSGAGYEVMLRTGMTNPPYIMQHLESVVEALQRPNVYGFMHVPVQSGSDAVLKAMKRKYTVSEFMHLVERLREGVPDIYLLTDIICGYPTETEEDWQRTLDLVKRCQFHGVYSSRFFARAGTPAARLKQLPHAVTKRRYQELSALEALKVDRFAPLLHRRERVWFAGSDEARQQTLGRTKNFAKDSLWSRASPHPGGGAARRCAAGAECHGGDHQDFGAAC
ncbi:unnamed protein product [Durusdinium trenchii]|uniref:Threonylcarbamoyladenosine tRNA methylthiotransferase n=1 Tax=Durusdinium trenchii TaxID=1381693 RepID=A0ABP0NFC9_9DINO